MQRYSQVSLTINNPTTRSLFVILAFNARRMEMIFSPDEKLIRLIREVFSNEMDKRMPLKMIEDSPYLNIKGASKHLNISVSTIRKAVTAGKIITTHHDMKDLRFHRDDLDKYARGYRNPVKG